MFHHLLPSFHRTVECGFRYVVVLGYDIGDRWWDLGGGAEQGRRWFQENIKSKLAAKNVQAELRYAVVDNKVKKPGPVFTMELKVRKTGLFLWTVHRQTKGRNSQHFSTA